MTVRIVTGQNLRDNPQYPVVPHVPLDRLRLDPAHLPEQRRKPDGTPVCLAGDHPVTGAALLCTSCQSEARNLSQARSRAARRTYEPISKAALSTIHTRVDDLAPLLTDLTTAYNNGGNLSDEMHRVMLAFKTIKRTIDDLLPDPRTGPQD